MEIRKNKAIFLDRDGVINRHIPYCSCPEDFELLPGVIEGILQFNKKGFKVVVVTNQSGIARGYFTEEMLSKIHNKMCGELAKQGGYIDAIYHCPHRPEDSCECRKPSPFMLRQAASCLDIDLNRSYVIGDSGIDMEMGRRVGCKTFLVCSSKENSKASDSFARADYVVPDVITAAKLIKE